MKRRKKLWIAGATLALAVALSAFVLTYRIVPYEFLRGAVYEETSVMESSIGGDPGVATHRFMVRGTMDSVAKAAEAELSADEGWKSETDLDFRYTKGDTSVVLRRPAPFNGYPKPGTVYVFVRGPASRADRLLKWFCNL